MIQMSAVLLAYQQVYVWLMSDEISAAIATGCVVRRSSCRDHKACGLVKSEHAQIALNLCLHGVQMGTQLTTLPRGRRICSISSTSTHRWTSR